LREKLVEELAQKERVGPKAELVGYGVFQVVRFVED
jgi:hypothetical protein